MEIDLKDYIKIIRKRLWLILLFVIVACVATAIISFYFIKPTYEASTKLIVNKSDQRQMEQLDLNTINMNLRLIDTYKEIIKTSRIMDKVVAEHPEFGLTSEQLSKRIKVSSVNNSQVMTLIIQDGSYSTAASIVNAISKIFVEEIPLILTLDNVSILEHAKMDITPSPVKPNPKLNIAISFVLSLMVALGISFLLEYFDDTIKSEEDVREYLGLPTLSMIMKIKEDDLQGHHSATTTQRQAGDVKRVTANQ